MRLQSIKKLIMFVLIAIAFLSCSNGPTLQTYFVDNELKAGFTTFDVPASLVGEEIEKAKLTDQQKRAYKSVNKLNVLAFKTDDSNQDTYKTELEKVKLILKDTKYEELIRGGNSTDGKFVVKFLGDIENIDELIVMGNANNKGFMVARILGDDMNATDLMSLGNVLQNLKIDNSQLNDLTSFFK